MICSLPVGWKLIIPLISLNKEDYWIVSANEKRNIVFNIPNGLRGTVNHVIGNK